MANYSYYLILLFHCFIAINSKGYTQCYSNPENLQNVTINGGTEIMIGCELVPDHEKVLTCIVKHGDYICAVVPDQTGFICNEGPRVSIDMVDTICQATLMVYYDTIVEDAGIWEVIIVAVSDEGKAHGFLNTFEVGFYTP